MRIRTAIVTLSYAFALVPTGVLAVAENDLSETDKEAIFRPCLTVDSDQVERCKARQLARLKIVTSGVRAIPTNAIDIYDRIDLGGARARREARLKRLQESRESIEQRKTYREYKPEDDVNVNQASYVGDLRAERLKCQLETPGRPRSMCFDRVAQKYREIMRQNSGARNPVAQ